MSQTLHACREEIIGSGDARGTASGMALGGSLLLHLGIVGLIFFMRPDAETSKLPGPEVSMAVSMVNYNPQLKRPALPESVDIEVENPVEETSPEPQLEEIRPEEASPAAQSAGIDQAPAPPPSTPASELPGNQAIENTGTPGVSAAEITNSVTTYVATYKRSLTNDWLSACLRYQNEHGVKTCPPGEDGKSETTKVVNETTSRLFSTYMGGTAASVRASRQLLAEMDAARPFLNENSVMGELARQRYELAQANYCRLNSCRSFALSTSARPTIVIFNTPVSNEGRITIAGFGNEAGGPGILSGLMSLMPGPKPAQPVAPRFPYRFTAPPAQQAESETEFKVIAPVFPVSR